MSRRVRRNLLITNELEMHPPRPYGTLAPVRSAALRTGEVAQLDCKKRFVNTPPDGNKRLAVHKNSRGAFSMLGVVLNLLSGPRSALKTSARHTVNHTDSTPSPHAL